MRSGSVSMPVRTRKAFIGESAGPRSRSPEHAARDGKRHVAERLPHLHAVIGGTGLAQLGYLPLPQSNLPESTMMPAIELPWPPRNFVAECSTMSAPHSIGRMR